MSNERLHHPHSPSSLQAKEACPKYANSFNTNEAAEVGTRQHTSAERETDDETLPDDKAAAVADVLQFCSERASMYPEHLLLKEEYFPVSDEIISDSKGNKFQGITGGYLDVAIISKDRKVAEILDHKFGVHAVEKADTNLQGIAYALGVVRRFPTIEKVFVWFLMPHLDWVTGTEFTKDQFPAMELRVRTVVSGAAPRKRLELLFGVVTLREIDDTAQKAPRTYPRRERLGAMQEKLEALKARFPLRTGAKQ